MSLTETVLSIGPISVRSSKAIKRFHEAQDFINESEAKYAFSGIETKSELFIYEEKNQTPYVYENEESFSVTKKGGAVFFEQTPYMISIHIEEAEQARIFSPLSSWCDSADWDALTKRLSIPLNFGNDLGDFELCWEWMTNDGVWHTSSIKAQVFSYKLDIQTHFKWMIDDVTQRMNWLKLDLLRQTSWGWKKDENQEGNQKTWLLIFQEVRNGMTKGFHRLIEQHRRRLMQEERRLPICNMKKTTCLSEEKIAEALIENPKKSFNFKKKSLNADTPENRFMKNILINTLNDLNEIIEKISKIEKISDVFKMRLQEWADELSQIKQHRFWKGIGDFHGLKKESLVLSQDPLYSQIRRNWFFLKQGMRFIDDDLKGGIQNAAQLYEIWCFVKIAEIIKDLGWEQISDNLIRENNNDDWEINDCQTDTAKITYQKDSLQKIQLDLLFQPTAGREPERKNIWDGMMSLPVVQRPDIVLRLHRKDLPFSPTYTWIFDAKYRINEKNNSAPDDAINQMHRYRDAILWSSGNNEERTLTRESIGAFVLYPGDDSKENNFPQIESIKKTNIGALPLIPTNDNKKNLKLRDHLRNIIDIKVDFEGVMEKEVEYFGSVPDIKRPMLGNVANAVVREYMDAIYWEKCRLFRTPVEQAEKSTVSPEKWEYIAPHLRNRSHFGVFPIKKMEVMRRDKIAEIFEKKGIYIRKEPSREHKMYYLFYLGDPIDAPLVLEKLKIGTVINVVEI